MDAEEAKQILDLSKNNLKKVPKSDDAQIIKILILDDNELQKIDNIDSYLRIEKLSLCKNQLLRMYGICRLHYLRDLNLSYNGILTIEGLKELTQLTHLNLEGNNIKSIEHLNSNIKLEYLNLSENSIGNIGDISFLKSLKELQLHGNRISHLRQCDKFLSNSIETLTLTKNNITDLNEICTLSHLINLHSISIADNPCVQMIGNASVGFDYRPFVLNWCMSVKIIDCFVVNPIESLKAEWLYSQGRGRQFRVGEQSSLARYLSSVCPLSGEALENENERKLRLILSKAQQHQRQLQEEISGTETNTSGSNSPSSSRRKGPSSRIQSPRFSRLRQGSPDSMSNSYHGASACSIISQHDNPNNSSNLIQMTTSLIENIKNDGIIMTQSLDPNILSSNNKNLMNCSQLHHQQENLNGKQNIMMMSQYNDLSSQMSLNSGGPLTAASKMVPVPESLMSPDCGPITIMRSGGSGGGGGGTSSSGGNVNISSTSSYLQTSNSGILKTTKSKGSPKPSRSSPHLKRNEKSPLLSPRKQATNALNHHRINSNNNINNNLHKINSVHINNQQLQHQHHHHNQIIDCSSGGNGGGNSGLSSDDDSEHINIDKLKTIRNKAAQKNQQLKDNLDIGCSGSGGGSVENAGICINKTTENSAILIQKIWRGFFIRKKTKYIVEKIQKKRTQEYITKLSEDMEITKAALENERKIQQLQMQAINALWKKVSAMEPINTNNLPMATTTTANQQNVTSGGDGLIGINTNDTNSTSVVQDLAKTCTVLTNQVQQLQGSMRDVVNCMTLFCTISQNNKLIQSTTSDTDIINIETKDNISTQTEIIAVNTPQIEHLPFPFINKLSRPSTLPLDTNDISPLIPRIGIEAKEDDDVNEQHHHQQHHHDKILFNDKKQIIDEKQINNNVVVVIDNKDNNVEKCFQQKDIINTSQLI